MHKTYLMFKHEFLLTIKRVSFIVMALIVPVLALLGIGILALVSSFAGPSMPGLTSIGYVDEVGIFDAQTTQGFVRMVPFASKEQATVALAKNEIEEYIVIPADYPSSGTVQRYVLEKELTTSPVKVAMIKSFLTWNLLEDDVPPEIITLIVAPLNLEVTRITEAGEPAAEQNSIGNVVIPGVFALLLSLALMLGATYLISGLGEEKESRLIEVLFSSVSVRQLLIAKVLALGIAGLLQVLVWLISMPLLLNLASSVLGGALSNIQIPSGFLVLGIVYFVLGYLLFAVLSIGIGAISSNAREGSQLSTIYTMASFIPLWFASLLIAFPNNPIWVVLSILPMTSPVQTMLRLGVSDVPVWQILISIGALVLSIVAGFFVSTKLFRAQMLMYGKRPSLAEIVRSLKNA